MKRGWYWWLVILAGSLPLGAGLQYFVRGGSESNSTLRTVLVVGQIILGTGVIALGLFKIKRARFEIREKDESLRITDEDQ